MGLSKGISIAVAAFVVVGAGAYYYMSQDEGQSKPSSASSSTTSATTVAANLPGESLIPPDTPSRKYKDWNEMAREYAGQHPENAGFSKFAEALNTVNAKPIIDQKPAIDAVLKNGWASATPQLDAAIRANNAALEAAFAAAQSAPFEMPAVGDMLTPVPNFLAAQSLFKMMLATARMAEASGDLNQAVERAVATARLAESFKSKNGFLISHLIGTAGTALSAKTLASILKNPAIPPQSAEWCLTSLTDLDSKSHGIAEGIRGEARTQILSMRRFKTDPEARKQLDPSAAKAADSIKSLPAYEQDVDRDARLNAANFEKPYYQRSGNPASNSILPGVAQPNYLEAATRSDGALAWLRLCEALAALRAGKTDTSTIRDPFADKPITVAADKVYSIAPDSLDQQGNIAYDPTNGTLSPGDIVAAR